MAEGGDAMIEKATKVTIAIANSGTNTDEVEISGSSGCESFRLAILSGMKSIASVILTFDELRALISETNAALIDAATIDVTLAAHRHRYDESGACRKEGCEARRRRERKAAKGAGA
jgi:hypothetical protein